MTSGVYPKEKPSFRLMEHFDLCSLAALTQVFSCWSPIVQHVPDQLGGAPRHGPTLCDQMLAELGPGTRPFPTSMDQRRSHHRKIAGPDRCFVCRQAQQIAVAVVAWCASGRVKPACNLSANALVFKLHSSQKHPSRAADQSGNRRRDHCSSQKCCHPSPVRNRS